MISKRDKGMTPVSADMFLWFVKATKGLRQAESGNGMDYYNGEDVLIAQKLDGRYFIKKKP